MNRQLLIAGSALLLAACNRSSARVEHASSPVHAAVAGDVALARDPATGDLLAAWTARAGASWQIQFARSADAGTSWTRPVVVTPDTGDASPPHGESSPRLVAASGGRLAIFWSRDVSAPGRKWPGSAMRMARSLDGGAGWSAATTLNSDSAGPVGLHAFFGAAVTGDHMLVAAWLDERHAATLEGHQAPLPDTSREPTSEADARIFAVTSSDFGEHWNHDAGIWGAVCPCCRVSLAATPDGGILAAWRQHFPGNIRDIVSAALVPASAPVRVARDDWEYPGCPHAGPAIAVDAGGTAHVVWYTGKEGRAGIYYARTVPGAEPSAPVALAVARTMAVAHASVSATSRAGALAAYDMTPAGERAIQVAWIGADGQLRETLSVPGSAGGQYPKLESLDDSTAVVAWTQADGVRVARVRLPGS